MKTTANKVNTGVNSILSNTPSTMNANEVQAPEFSELTHAGQCLDIYLHNTREIYERYTVPAIEQVTKNAPVHGCFMNWDTYPLIVKDWAAVKNAIQAAARLVKKCDNLTPTVQDIEQVTRNYAAYIVDCAKYELETAAK